MSATEEIKARLDIVNYVQQYVPLKKAGRTYKACCPFHAEKTPSFVVNPDTQTWRCYGACAEGGDIFNFAMKQHGWSFGEALRELGRAAGVEVHSQTPAQKARAEVLEQVYGVLQTAADVYHQYLLNSQDPAARDVLHYAREKRGFTDDTIQRFMIGYAPPGWQNMLDYLSQLGYSEELILQAGIVKRNEQGRVYDVFRNRLVIPIRDERGRVIAFGARALDPDDTPKYLNSPQTIAFDKSRVLFGLDFAKRAIRDTETAVIVEGYMDVIQAHQAGYANVVAQMGTAMTEAQLKLIAPALAKKIILALDADAAGQSATRRSLEVARQVLTSDYSGRLSVDIRILQIPDAKDPDDLLRESPKHWSALVDAAIPVADYVIEMETVHLPPNTSVQEREAVARRLLPILLASENNLYRKDNLQKLARKLRIAENDLLAWAQEQRRTAAARPPQTPPPALKPRPVKTAPLTDDGPPEPPPLDYDSIAPPDAGAFVFTTAPSVKKLPAAQPHSSHEVEGYCLRMLLQNPNLLYHANRKFRQLGGENADLLHGPLGDLSDEDFSRSEYRVLMQVLKAALNQDAVEPLEFLRRNLDDGLQPELEALLVDDLTDTRKRTGNWQPADTDMVWKQHARYRLPSTDAVSELIQAALQLRQQRLRREGEELRFLQMESQGYDGMFAHRYKLALQARFLLDVALHRQAETLTSGRFGALPLPKRMR